MDRRLKDETSYKSKHRRVGSASSLLRYAVGYTRGALQASLSMCSSFLFHLHVFNSLLRTHIPD